MADQEQVAILKRGVDVWNAWRAKHPEITPDLSGAKYSNSNFFRANFKGAKLADVEFGRAVLSGADFEGADLSRASLYNADLSHANLRGANLHDVNLRGANLDRAHLGGADLSKARLAYCEFKRTFLRNAGFQSAEVGYGSFLDTDLSEAKDLTKVSHMGPSYIGIDTIYRSGGRIPAVFLRGAGVPDNFITYTNSLVGTAIEFYSCFISYSTKDKEFAERLYADLQTNNVRCWFAPHDIQGGKKIHEQIDEAIRMHDKLLLILSPASIKSAWVETEIAKARKRETRDERRVLFPVRLVDLETLHDWECFDADTGKDSAREIREFFIPDFSDWKNHDSYQNAFQRLLKDLKAK
jgi:hypothetical protein